MKTPTNLKASLLAICLAVLAAAAANAGSALNRLSDRSDLLGWEAVGRLDLAGKGFCTGTLIAADLVLTAAHCVFDRQSGQLLQPGQVTFRAGLRDGVSIAVRSGLQIAVSPDYVPLQALTWDNVRRDVALLRLSQPIGTSDADPFVIYAGSDPGRDVSVASYGKGRAEAISRQRQCRLLQSADDLMSFDCNVTFGSSGAPVFAASGGRGRILSVISGMARVDGRTVAIGMALPKMVATLKAQMRRAPVAGPLRPIRRLRVGSGARASGAKFIRP